MSRRVIFKAEIISIFVHQSHRKRGRQWLWSVRKQEKKAGWLSPLFFISVAGDRKNFEQKPLTLRNCWHLMSFECHKHWEKLVPPSLPPSSCAFICYLTPSLLIIACCLFFFFWELFGMSRAKVKQAAPKTTPTLNALLSTAPLLYILLKWYTLWYILPSHF